MLRDSVLAGKQVLLGLTGGVACYKAAEAVRELTRAGASVQVMMSDAACQFITPTTLQALSGRPVHTSQWDARMGNAMPHINLTRGADALLIAPASADFIAKLAQGRADEIVSLTCLARPRERAPLLIAPAMNREMWRHPATQRNVAQVLADGAVLAGPDVGDQACGEVGEGRMLEPLALVAALAAALTPKVLAGRRVLITAGPTFEPIDPVRGLTNHSSGKMGFAIARAAQEAGAAVTLVAGPVALATPAGVQRVDVQTAAQMLAAVQQHAAALTPRDVFIAAAAVADWRPSEVAGHKLKKDGSGQPPPLAFTENTDILATLAARPGAPYCVGFAAESHDLIAHASAKRLRKGIPLIAANLGPATFGRDDNALVLIDAAGQRELPRAGKLTLARALVAEVAQRLPA